MVTWLAVVYDLLIATLAAKEPPTKGRATPAATPVDEDLSLTAAKVDIKPVARDEEIRERTQSVLEASE